MNDLAVAGAQAAARSRTTRRSRRRRARAPYLFVLPVVVLFAAFKAYPLGYALWLSLTRNVGGANSFVGLDNYDRLLGDPLFWKALRNTAAILVIQVPIMLALAVGLAVAFHSTLLRLSRLLRVSFFLPVVMSLVAYGILFGFLLNKDFGVVNGVLTDLGLPAVPWLSHPLWAQVSIGLALTWHYTGYSAMIYLAQLTAIPTELYEAASVDGASALRRFWHITLPGLRPALVLTIVLSTIGTLQLFDEPYVLTGGAPDNATLTIGLYLYRNGFSFFDFGYAAAIGYALTALILVVAALQFRVLRERRT